MEQNRIPIGFDVSKKHIDVCLITPDSKLQRLRIGNSHSGFQKLLSWIDGIPLSALHACLEPTGNYSRALAFYLHALGVKISQVNSYSVMNHGRSKNFRSKTDKIDAFLLADYCLKHDPPTWTPASEVQRELKEIEHRIASLDVAIQQEENRIEANPESQLVIQDIEESLSLLKRRREKLEKAAKELIQKDERLAMNFGIIKSIIGLGDKSSIRLLGMVQFEQFAEARQVACFSGLTPRKKESGSSIHGKERISKTGSGELRAALYMPALVAIQHNPQMRDFAERLEKNNKPKKVIICAVMRKLLVLAATLIRKQQYYDPNYESKPALS